MLKKGIGKVSEGDLKRGMILDPSQSGFGLENGGPGGSKSDKKVIKKRSQKRMLSETSRGSCDPTPVRV